jgi:hypothetical protein
LRYFNETTQASNFIRYSNFIKKRDLFSSQFWSLKAKTTYTVSGEEPRWHVWEEELTP